MDYQIAPIADEPTLVALLEVDRYATAYALCDLDPPYRKNARFIGASRGGELKAVSLLYALPSTTALHAYGDVEAASAIFQGWRELPEKAYLILSPEHVAAAHTRYTPRDSWHILRMVVEADELTAAAAVALRLARLGPADVPAMTALYSLWAGKTFDESMGSRGVYYGAFAGDRLVAIAGTHAVSATRGIAAIGGVFTHPDFRGRGLATAVTDAVCQEIISRGIQLIVLNVVDDNEPAVAAYKRLGFRVHSRLYEGPAVLKSHEL
jgi:ribosomal protein S18 acetylase RimI-like enzyme